MYFLMRGRIFYPFSVVALLLLAPAAKAGTSWNPSDANASITLSTTNFTNDTASSAAGAAFAAVRGTNSPAKTNGKWHIEFQIKAFSGNYWIVGFADSSDSLSIFCGQSVDGVGAQNSALDSLMILYAGASNVFFANTPNVNDIIALEVDIPNTLLWVENVTQATGWTNSTGGFTGNPGAGIGGFAVPSLTTTGGVMPCWSGGSGNAVIMFTTASSLSGAVSSGFSAWESSSSAAMPTRTLLGLGQ